MPGVYQISFTPLLAGKYFMYIQFNGLNVDQSPYTLTVLSAATTAAATSTITPFSMSYTSG
jgi:hypothetical protein